MNARDLFNKWVLLGALLFAGFLLLVTAISIGLTAARQTPDVGLAPADVTVIPAPTGTSGAPPTPTIDPFATPTLPAGVAIGNYVQIDGTEGRDSASARTRAWMASLNFLPMIWKYLPSRTVRGKWMAMCGGILSHPTTIHAPAGPRRTF